MIIYGWEMRSAGAPLIPQEWVVDTIERGHVAVRVAGCAVCEVDTAVAGRTAPPTNPVALPLGHEVSGTVVAAGDNAHDWLGRSVIVPAIPPAELCNDCWTDSAGWRCQGAGDNKVRLRTGFASHVIVPARGLCAVDDSELLEHNIDLADLAVVAEAIGTPYQAISRACLREGDTAIFIGSAEPGAFGIQIACVLGAHVIALDTDDDRLGRAQRLGASFALNTQDQSPSKVLTAVRSAVQSAGRRISGWKIFEMSGNAHGQLLARELLGPGGFLALVGYAHADVSLRMSDLVTCVATAQGFCHCMTEHLPEALELVIAGDVHLAPLIEHVPMSTINEALEGVSGGAFKRPILIPDF